MAIAFAVLTKLPIQMRLGKAKACRFKIPRAKKNLKKMFERTQFVAVDRLLNDSNLNPRISIAEVEDLLAALDLLNESTSTANPNASGNQV